MAGHHGGVCWWGEVSYNSKPTTNTLLPKVLRYLTNFSQPMAPENLFQLFKYFTNFLQPMFPENLSLQYEDAIYIAM